MTEPWHTQMRRDCEHGRLARSCEICELITVREHQKLAARWFAHSIIADEVHAWEYTVAESATSIEEV